MHQNNPRRAPYLTDIDSLIQAIRLGEVGIWRWKIDSDQLDWSENLESIHKLPKGAFDGTISTFQRDIHPADSEAVWLAIREAIESGGPYRVIYRTARPADEPPVWIEARGGVIKIDGERYLTGVCNEVSDRVVLEEELRRRLRQQEGIKLLGTLALASNNVQEVCDKAVEIAADIFDAPLVKILHFGDMADRLEVIAGTGWREGLVGNTTVGIEHHSQAGYTLLSDAPVIVDDFHTEDRFESSSLLREHGARSGMSVVIAGSGVRPFGVLGIHTKELRQFDAIDSASLQSLANILAYVVRQQTAEEQRKLLMGEMHHRSNNLLQVVANMANQSFVEGTELEEARRRFQERLSSVGRANDTITRGGWGPSRIGDVLRQTLQPYADRFSLEGRDILLPAKLCFDLGLVFHELATNSVKYGTLGKTAGEVVIKWRLNANGGGEEIFELNWFDPVTGFKQSTGNGYGSKLKHALIERKWNGVIKIDIGDGYRFTCRIPLPDTTGSDALADVDDFE